MVEIVEDRIIEVADGSTVTCTQSGTICIKTFTENLENITIYMEGVLHAPQLIRRLFSLMSLIEQNHMVQLSNSGIKLFFKGQNTPVHMNLPNYHLFASNTLAFDKSEPSSTKQKIDLKLLYHRMGCRGLDTLLSASKSGVWADVEARFGKETVADCDHHIATIRKANRKRTANVDPNLKPGQVLSFDITYNPSKTGLTNDSYFQYYLLVVDKCSRMPFLMGLENASAQSVISAFNDLRSQLFEPESKLFETNLAPISRLHTDFGSVFTSNAFSEMCSENNFNLTMANPKHLEMNSVLERTWQSILDLKNTFLVHARMGEMGTDFALQYACQVFSVIPVKTLRLGDSIMTPYEVFTGRKPNTAKFRVLFCHCIMKKYTVTKKLEDGRTVTEDVKKTYAQRGFRGIYVGFDPMTNGYLVYVPATCQVVTSSDIIFDESFKSTLAEGDKPFREALAVRPIQDLPVSWSEITDRTGDISTMSPFGNAFDTVKNDPAHKVFKFLQDHHHVIDFNDIYYHLQDNFASNSNDVLSSTTNTSTAANYDSDSVTKEATRDEANLVANTDDNSDDSDDSDVEEATEEIEEDPPVFMPRRSNRARKPTLSQDFVYLSKEVEEETNWSQFGDPTSFIPEPRGIRAIMRLKKTDPLAYKLWTRAIKKEVKVLINHGTFKIEDPKNNEPVIPTLEVMKVKFSSDGTWDKAKARIVCRGDLQRQYSTEDTWNALAAKRTLRMFLADAASFGARIYQIDFIGVFFKLRLNKLHTLSCLNI